ncbi:reverse transcriptase domain-containing protein [Tanacetum coccineum]
MDMGSDNTLGKNSEMMTLNVRMMELFMVGKIDVSHNGINWKARWTRLHGKFEENLEVYVDDLVIKSCTEDEVVRDIEETFKMLKKINMKLNPKKYTFGVEEGTFLGYQVNTKGIKICPDKVLSKVSGEIITILQNFKKMHKRDVNSYGRSSGSAFRQMKETYSKRYLMFTALEEQEETYRFPKREIQGGVLADFIVRKTSGEGQTTPQRKKETAPGTVDIVHGGSFVLSTKQALEDTGKLGPKWAKARTKVKEALGRDRIKVKRTATKEELPNEWRVSVLAAPTLGSCLRYFSASSEIPRLSLRDESKISLDVPRCSSLSVLELLQMRASCVFAVAVS